ncbi:MAG TPA: class I adenylate-forming enzyme family protein [Xanthobacteraceae bacterium]|nr:class I adenylate-forming enzyme family protein [Xanthobacteraceae bacterium]
MNIFDAFLFQARHQPTAPAICAPGRTLGLISYGRLEALANNAARRALAQGIKRGDTVAVICTDPVLHWILVLGLGRIGAISVSAIEPSVPAECNVSVAITDTAGGVRNAARVLAADGEWLAGDGQPADVESEPDRHATARIILTSGTTGRSKAVALSHDVVIRRIQAFDVAFGNRIPTCARTFVDVGISANIGFLWGIYLLARGGTLFLRGRDAAETLQAFTLYNVQCMVASPGGMAEFLDYYEQSPAFTSPFEAVLSVGSLLSKPLADRVRAAVCSHVVSGYGATEGNPVAAAPTHHIAGIAGAVGYVCPGMVVQAAGAAARPLAAGTEGLIRFRGHTCVAGYLGNPPGSEAFFRDGWFYPGDIGRVTADGVLVIAGREKTIIDLGGDKISPDTIETALMSYPGVILAAAFGQPNALGIEEAWAVVTANTSLDSAAMRAHCARKLPAVQVPARIAQVPEIPRTAAGKVDRRRLQEMAKAL